MKPTLLHRIVQSVIARRLRKVTSVGRSIKVHPQIAAYGSQRMCQLCGAITARSEPFCLECGEETGPAKCDELCAEIWRVLRERDEIRKALDIAGQDS